MTKYRLYAEWGSYFFSCIYSSSVGLILALYSVFLLYSTLKVLMEKRSLWQCLSNYNPLFYLLCKVTWSLYRPLAMFNCRSTSLIQKFLIFSVYTDFYLQLCTFTIIHFSSKLLNRLFHMCFSHAVRQLLSECLRLQSLFVSQHCDIYCGNI